MADNKKTAPADSGEQELQKAADEATAQGFLGARTDPTPLHHYTLPGVVAGKPTPETDFDAAVESLKVRVAGAEGVQPPT